jgi:hypothetical protein
MAEVLKDFQRNSPFKFVDISSPENVAIANEFKNVLHFEQNDQG